MSVRAMRAAFVVFAVTMIALVLGGYLGIRYLRGYPDRPASDDARQVTLVIPKGADFDRVTALLAERGLIASPIAFRLFAKYTGQASRVRAGRYRLKTTITPRQLLNVLEKGVPSPTVTVTIPEGKTMLEVADILARARIASRARLVRQMREIHFLRRIGVPGDTIEGFLFPDTYKLQIGTPARRVLRAMFRRHMTVFVRARRAQQKGWLWLRKRLGWGHREIVILASIVEKETGRSFERPLIAGVFLNRLTFSYFRPKLLQTDPTIIYGCVVPEEKSPACQRFKGRIRRIHLEDRENPYNTYTHAGLPPGPIANPGRAALEAVLAPKRSRFLYFVSKNDGTHKFSRTRAEHERAVNRYQRRRRRPASKP